MTDPVNSSKIKHWHLERYAIDYVRQSDPQQPIRHPESTARQYALVDRAVALGWPRERVLVIDEDQGRTASTAEGRSGFHYLMAEVALGHVGLILSSEVSRPARCCKDWHLLLELCGRFGTLLGDGDGLYDPTDYNDRLLLGIKGIMSEAELHILKDRMHGAKLNKARRGELFNLPPIGYVKIPTGPSSTPTSRSRPRCGLSSTNSIVKVRCMGCSATWSTTRFRSRCGHASASSWASWSGTGRTGRRC